MNYYSIITNCMDIFVSKVNFMGSNKCALNQLFMLTCTLVVKSSPNFIISMMQNDAEQCNSAPEQGGTANLCQ